MDKNNQGLKDTTTIFTMCLLKYISVIIFCGILTTFANVSEAKTLQHLNPQTNPSAATNNSSISGIQQLRILRELIRECENSSQSSASSKTWQCLKLTSVHLFEDITARDIIPVCRGVQFVRESIPSPDNHHEFWKRVDLQYLTWLDRVALSFGRLLSTHRLEINLKDLTETFLRMRGDKDNVGTARHRRHRFNMMVTMMFGVTALGSVLVPMGFQLLSVVSGKALLLAKMALLLASINGLKRVANTGLHYGLYHVPGEHYGGYYDRGDVHHPRNVQIPTTGSQALNV